MRTNVVTVRLTSAELKRLDVLVKRELKKGNQADRSVLVRQLIDREHRRGRAKK